VGAGRCIAAGASPGCRERGRERHSGSRGARGADRREAGRWRLRGAPPCHAGARGQPTAACPPRACQPAPRPGAAAARQAMAHTVLAHTAPHAHYSKRQILESNPQAPAEPARPHGQVPVSLKPPSKPLHARLPQPAHQQLQVLLRAARQLLLETPLGGCCAGPGLLQQPRRPAWRRQAQRAPARPAAAPAAAAVSLAAAAGLPGQGWRPLWC
jgi:hypothetical protein